MTPDGTDVLAAVTQIADLALEDLPLPHQLRPILGHDVLRDGWGILNNLLPSQS